MSLKDFLREYCASGCFIYKRLLQIRKKVYLNLFCQPFANKIPFLDKFLYKKKSDTIFILGSGASVNDLTPKQWDFIKQHDSVGFNLWLVHDFVPDFYMFETADRDSDPAILNRTQDFFYNLRMKENLYKDVKMIYKMNTELSRNFLVDADLPQSILKNIYFSPVIFLAYHNIATMKKALKVSMHALDKSKALIHIHTAATMFDLIIFAVKFKFKKIVLVGVDLTADYFYETQDFQDYLREKKLKLPSTLTTPEEKKSGINGIETWFKIPISVIIDEIDKTILAPRGIKLFVSSRKSRLYPKYPCFFDE